MSPPGHITKNPTRKHKRKAGRRLGSMMALAAVIVFAVYTYQLKSTRLPPAAFSAQNSGADSAQLNTDDQQLISQLSQQARMRAAPMKPACVK